MLIWKVGLCLFKCAYFQKFNWYCKSPKHIQIVIPQRNSSYKSESVKFTWFGISLQTLPRHWTQDSEIMKKTLYHGSNRVNSLTPGNKFISAFDFLHPISFEMNTAWFKFCSGYPKNPYSLSESPKNNITHEHLLSFCNA